jgi:hypothetical protein
MAVSTGRRLLAKTTGASTALLVVMAAFFAPVSSAVDGKRKPSGVIAESAVGAVIASIGPLTSIGTTSTLN